MAPRNKSATNCIGKIIGNTKQNCSQGQYCLLQIYCGGPYLRQRQMLLSYASQHVQKALQQMNVKLPEVVSDVMGVTGQCIIRAILRGERNPKELAKMRDGHCKRNEDEIARALYGNWRDEHLFALQQAIELYDFYHRKLQECDLKLEAHLKTFVDRSEGRELPEVKKRTKKRRANEPLFDVRRALQRMCGQDLTVIEGIDTNTSLVVLSEIGCDMSKWPTVKHFVSWLGLCPQHRSSAGKIRSRRIRRGSSRAGRALRLAAQGCHHAKNALGAFYRRIQARAGGPKAVVATARKIGERIYRLLKYGVSYVRQKMAEYEAKYRARMVKGLSRKARELGFELVPTAAEATQRRRNEVVRPWEIAARHQAQQRTLAAKWPQPSAGRGRIWPHT